MIESPTRTNDVACRPKTGVKVPLEIDSGTISRGSVVPLSFGIPFPKGAIRPPFTTRLQCKAVGDVLIQSEPLIHWSDGSVKWLLADLLLTGESERYRDAHISIHETRAADALRSALRFEQHADCYHVHTGTHNFHLPAAGYLQPFTSINCATSAAMQQFGSILTLIDKRGRVHQPFLQGVHVESIGPVRLTLRMDGYFPKMKGLKVCLRESFFANTGLVRLDVTLHNARRARHRGGMWDLGDPGSHLIEDFSLTVALPGTSPQSLAWSTHTDDGFHSTTVSTFSLYQDSSGGENWNSQTHVNRDGRVPCRFRGYDLTVGHQRERGHRASPVVHLLSADCRFSVAVPEFWQQFPKALTINKSELRVGLFPYEFDDLFEFQGGERKTQTIWLDFAAETPSEEANSQCRFDWVHEPMGVRVPLDWIEKTEALPSLTLPASSSSQKFLTVLHEARQGPRSIPVLRELVDEYGWRNFGDIYADHEELHYSGDQPLVSHYNNQFDLVLGFLMQFLRTGDPTWFEWGDALARHVADIDIYHTSEDRAAYNGGLFWFTDHYLHACTSTHRTYSRRNRGFWWRPYGGGPAPEHNFTSGLLLHFCLTGNPHSKSAVLSLADWVIAMDDGRRTFSGIIDDGPTGLASGAAGTLGRAAGNSINALVDAWLLTKETKYLDYAEKLIRRCVHPNDDIASRELLHAEKSWSYTVFFRSLAKYLDVKLEASQLDEMYAYAQVSLVHYANWMLANEQPYFEQADRLEYPTETWAAQELRKANILRLAARHVNSPLREKLQLRGNELGDRAWSDLYKFDRKVTARALSIVMVEGLLDCVIRRQVEVPVPQRPPHCAFYKSETFIPQRQRIKQSLRQPSQWAKTAGRLLNPIRWARYWF